MDDPPRAMCWKQKQTTLGFTALGVTWPERYIMLSQPTGKAHMGLYVFAKEGDSEPRGSSIEKLLGVDVTKGVEKWSKLRGGDKPKLSLSADFLPGKSAHFCFQSEATRDAFFDACVNVAAGRQWSDGSKTQPAKDEPEDAGRYRSETQPAKDEPEDAVPLDEGCDAIDSKAQPSEDQREDTAAPTTAWKFWQRSPTKTQPAKDEPEDAARLVKTVSKRLCDAVEKGHLYEVREILISQPGSGATKQRDGWIFAGQPALNLAAEGKHVEIAELLLENHADVTMTGTLGYTALHAAVNAQCPPIVALLLRHRAPVDARAKELTPLHLIMISAKTRLEDGAGDANLECARLLVAAGADDSIKPFNEGSTALQLADALSDRRMGEVLRNPTTQCIHVLANYGCGSVLWIRPYVAVPCVIVTMSVVLSLISKTMELITNSVAQTLRFIAVRFGKVDWVGMLTALVIATIILMCFIWKYSRKIKRS